MRAEIENVGKVIDFAIANGAFKDRGSAATAINSIHALEQKANVLQQEHEQAIKMLEEANKTIEELKAAPKLVKK